MAGQTGFNQGSVQQTAGQHEDVSAQIKQAASGMDSGVQTTTSANPSDMATKVEDVWTQFYQQITGKICPDLDAMAEAMRGAVGAQEESDAENAAAVQSKLSDYLSPTG